MLAEARLLFWKYLWRLSVKFRSWTGKMYTKESLRYHNVERFSKHAQR